MLPWCKNFVSPWQQTPALYWQSCQFEYESQSVKCQIHSLHRVNQAWVKKKKKEKRYDANIGFVLKNTSYQTRGYIQINLLLLWCAVAAHGGEENRESFKGHKWECERNGERESRRDPDTCVHFVRLCLFACEADRV